MFSNLTKAFTSILFAVMAGAGTVTAGTSDVTIAWPLTDGPDGANAATVSADGLFSVTSFSHGDMLRSPASTTATRVCDGVTLSQFEPVEQASANADGNAIVFSIKPKKGVTFRPTSISFKGARNGTGGGEFDLVLASPTSSVTVAEKTKPTTTVQQNLCTQFDYTINDFGATSDLITFKLYLKSLATNKQYAFGDFIITGVADGEPEEVPAYTLNLGISDEAAGSVTCTPAGGNVFDQGTIITVSASENFGYHFASWDDENGKTVSTANPYSFELTANTTLVAHYTANEVYPINLSLEGGANVNQVQYSPEGHVVDGIHYYEAGTDVRLSVLNNRILSFTNWEDNSTSPEREVRMDSEKNLKAIFSAADYIVGWDFYFDQPNSERAADYRAESDNAGLLSLRNAAGNTTSWLTRGIGNGAENGKWGARIWKKFEEKYYFETSFSTTGYTNIILSCALGVNYNTYSTVKLQYSLDGKEFVDFGSYTLKSGWTSDETPLPAQASNQPRVWIRFMPDYDSPIVGNTGDYDGLCISELYILAEKESVSDDVPPVLVTTLPGNNAKDASSTGSIILTFDEKVKVGTGNATLDGVILSPVVSGKSIIYQYTGLDYGTTYTFNVPEGAITDRSGNPFAGTTLTFTTLERSQPEARLYDAIVAADGSGDHATVQDAIDAAPAGRVKPWLIFVKNGNYKEHVDIPATKPFIHIIGQDRDKTVILDDKLCGGDNALHVSVGATVVVNSNDCLFENITLENSYGHERQEGPQALALNTTADRTIFNNVAMLSYQDTWITPSTSSYRAYVRNSLIEGAVDFIYNSGDIYIDNSTLLITRKSGGYIVAPSHKEDVAWGYVFNNCVITAPGVPSETSVWLGRPWHNAPKTVFLNTRAEVTIPATGWYETMGGLPAIWADWNTTDANGNLLDLSQRRDTYYKVENGNKIYGKAKNHLTDEEAATYTVKNVLSGTDNWQPVIKTEPCATPVATIDENGSITWTPVPYAICYLVTRGDEVIGFTTEPALSVATMTTYASDDAKAYSVQAVNEFGGLSAKGIASETQSGIESIETDSDAVRSVYYDLHGRQLPTPCKGVTIVKHTGSNGVTKAEKIMF